MNAVSHCLLQVEALQKKQKIFPTDRNNATDEKK